MGMTEADNLRELIIEKLDDIKWSKRKSDKIDEVILLIDKLYEIADGNENDRRVKKF